MTDEIVFNSDGPSINERFVEIYKNFTGDKEVHSFFSLI
jgi:hypothetical protein